MPSSAAVARRLLLLLLLRRCLDRRRLLTSKADDARYQRLGSLLLHLRAKLCRGRDGLRAFERWRKYNAAVAVAVLIQKRWRGHRIRCASSRYRRRIEYCRAYGVHYHSLFTVSYQKKVEEIDL